MWERTLLVCTTTTKKKHHHTPVLILLVLQILFGLFLINDFRQMHELWMYNLFLSWYNLRIRLFICFISNQHFPLYAGVHGCRG